MEEQLAEVGKNTLFGCPLIDLSSFLPLKTLFFASPKDEIRARNVLHAKLTKHGHQLAAVIGAMVEYMEYHLENGLLKMFPL